MSTAWMLRNDGKDVPVRVHLYCMQDEDLSSEAEVASFILTHGVDDHSIAEYTLDCWMACLAVNNVMWDYSIDQINDVIRDQVSKYINRFPFPLSMDQYMKIHEDQGNFSDFDSLMDFYDKVMATIKIIWDKQNRSLNQQFIRSRFGGKYDTKKGNNEMWFRIGSIGFNWSNVIYIWTINNKHKFQIEYIYICRDAESDNGFDSGSSSDVFYKARDGTPYFRMPIDEFLNGEHDSNPVFASSRISDLVGNNQYLISDVSTILSNLDRGNSIDSSILHLNEEPKGVISLLRDIEIGMCIDASEWTDSLKGKSSAKARKIENTILERFPEIYGVEIDKKESEGPRGGTGFEMFFELVFVDESLDNLTVSVKFNKDWSYILPESIVRRFTTEYTDYLRFSGIQFDDKGMVLR